MKQLKRLIAVYEELIVVKGHYFKVSMSKDVLKDEDDSLFELYHNDYLVAGTIRSYKGLIEVAEAYLTGDNKVLEAAQRKWCLCYFSH